MSDDVKPIKRILVANRGEIAVRIIASIHRLGLHAIAVYSDFDKNAQHVKLANEALFIGESEASDSYLSGEKIIEAAKHSRADAIHPGYGFLSENSDFALNCQAAGLVFIGPSPAALNIMGNKASAKRKMLECGIVCIDGYQGGDQSDEALRAAGDNIGYPVMLKAAGGGGGRGMRLVEHPDQLTNAILEARAEALNSFGSDSLISEKYIRHARHIEFQVLGDNFGNLIHLGERDCSLQRRHQKVIEEAPSPALNEVLRAKMGKVAVKAASSVSYRGAGTIEFLLTDNNEFFFLEMNPRLQVEHPVTELITGLDLVEWQIRIAAGEKLDIQQSDIKLSGHAIEARIYAEDPAREFVPSTGEIIYWRAPKGPNGPEGPKGICVRVDSGIVTGDHIGPYYDALLSKIIVHANDSNDTVTNRNSARLGLISALNKTVLQGPEHNKQFLLELLGGDVFSRGEANIKTIDENTGFAPVKASVVTACFAALLDFTQKRQWSHNQSIHVPETLLDWSSSPMPPPRIKFEQGCQKFDIAIEAKGNHRYQATCDDRQLLIELSGNQAKVENDILVADHFVNVGNKLYLSCAGRDYTFVDLTKNSSQTDSKHEDGTIISPMHGVLVEVSAQPGQKVDANTRLAVLEAMKMRHEILAGVKGVVRSVFKQASAQVAGNELLFEIEPEGNEDATGE